MWGRIRLVGLVFFMGLAGDAFSERISSPVFCVLHGEGDTVRDSRDSAADFRMKKELDASLLFSGSYLLHWARDQSDGNLLVIQDLKYRLELERTRKYRFTGQFVHTLGIQHYFDSITRVHTDRNALTLQFDLLPERVFRITFLAQAETQLFDGYALVAGNGGLAHQRTSSFLTPLVCNLSLGPCITLKKTGVLKFGLTGVKITWLRERALAYRYGQSLYALPEGKVIMLEYGLTLSLNADRNIVKCLRWTCDLLLFKNYDKPAELNLKNQVTLKITRFLKAVLQTRLLYEDQVSKHLQMENILSVGLNFHR